MSGFQLARVLAALFTLIFALSPQSATAQQLSNEMQLSLPADREQMNANTVSIITGNSQSLHLRLVEDMASILDDGLSLRVIPMVGKGAVQNVFDLLHLRNVDMGITQADVLSYLQHNSDNGSSIDGKLLYITKLFNEELHLVASPDVTDISQLEGKRINVGRIGSGTQLTASLLFAALGMKIITAHLEQSEALAAIRKGELNASLIIAGKPSPIFDLVRAEDGLKLVNIPYVPKLEDSYLPTILTHDDYPLLIGKDEVVDSIAVPAVLTVFNWAPTNDRYRRVTKLVNAFFDNVSRFSESHRHEKWKELNLIAPLKGWRRFPPAQQWIDKHLAGLNSTRRSRTAEQATGKKSELVEFMSNKADAGANLSQEVQDRLFREFLEWQRQNPATGNPATRRTPTSEPADAGGPKGNTEPAPSRLW